MAATNKYLAQRNKSRTEGKATKAQRQCDFRGVKMVSSASILLERGRTDMRTPQWIKKLGGHAGELYVCAELAKRGIPAVPLPENFSDDDILVGDKAAKNVAFVQVKACHPDRSASFILRETHGAWCEAAENQFCVFVWLGRPGTFEPPRYWIARKSEVGRACVNHPSHGTKNWERRFFPPRQGNSPYDLPAEWENRWSLFDAFQPSDDDAEAQVPALTAATQALGSPTTEFDPRP